LAVWLLATVIAGSMLATACGAGTRARAPDKPPPLGPNQAEVTIPDQGPTQPIPSGFFGFSTEFTTLPLLEQHFGSWEKLLYLLTNEGDLRFPLRIGGDSAEHVRFSNQPIQSAPWAFMPTKKLVDDTTNVIKNVGLRVIIDINTVSSTEQETATWMRDLWKRLNKDRGVGVLGGKIVAFEIGNEPDIYSQLAWKHGIGIEGNAPANPAGVAPADLPKEFTATSFAAAVQAYAGALHSAAPTVPVIAPALSEATKNLGWIKTLLRRRIPNLKLISAHVYPYSACARPGDPTYPTIGKILSENATAGIARTVRPAIAVAHAAGLGFRLTEINSVTCGGLEGVSNTFATALWAPDALFELLRAGVEGVSLHARVTSINRPFSFDRQGLETRPLLYGLLLFARMLGPGARLVPVHLRSAQSLHLKVWAVRYTQVDPLLAVMLINKGRRSARITLHLPTRYPGSVMRLLAPSASATSGVTLGGMQLNHNAGWSGKDTEQDLKPSRDGSYVVPVRGESAALLTVKVPASTLPPPTRPAGPAPMFGYY
jgi:hypothetical protein